MPGVIEEEHFLIGGVKCVLKIRSEFHHKLDRVIKAQWNVIIPHEVLL